MAVWFQASGDFLATADMARFLDVNTNTSVATGLLGSSLTWSSSGWSGGKIFPSGAASVWGHFHVLRDTANNYGWCVLSENSYRHLIFQFTQGGFLAVYRSSDNAGWNDSTTGTLLGTGTIQTKSGVWYSVEFEVTIDDSAGIVKTWINGQADLSLTSQDTKAGASATATVSRFHLFSNGISAADNILFGDSTSPNTGHPGEIRVDCMMPDANGTDRANGGSGEMTRSTGADDYTLVDETAASAGTGDYFYSDAVGEKCSLNVAALTNTGGTIVAVQCTVYATKNEAGPCGFKIYCLRGGTRYYSDEFFPSFGSWVFFRKVWDQDPSTSAAWTESNFNAAEFGVERTT